MDKGQTIHWGAESAGWQEAAKASRAPNWPVALSYVVAKSCGEAVEGRRTVVTAKVTEGRKGH
jgi:hypothetical protein